ncbi:hypothetical protein BH10PSE12_BH10PSE12_31920 [soil metagenome]
MKPILILIPFALAACATTTPETVPTAGAGACRNDELAQFVGHKVDAELSHLMMKTSGAKVLRWGPPGAAMTMDFRQDRLTVSYDDQMVVTSARCG